MASPSWTDLRLAIRAFDRGLAASVTIFPDLINGSRIRRERSVVFRVPTRHSRAAWVQRPRRCPRVCLPRQLSPVGTREVKFMFDGENLQHAF